MSTIPYSRVSLQDCEDLGRDEAEILRRWMSSDDVPSDECPELLDDYCPDLEDEMWWSAETGGGFVAGAPIPADLPLWRLHDRRPYGRGLVDVLEDPGGGFVVKAHRPGCVILTRDFDSLGAARCYAEILATREAGAAELSDDRTDFLAVGREGVDLW